MLPDEANIQKQKKRDEQIRKWREREQELQKGDAIDGIKTTRVRFPKGCVFLASCASGDVDEVRQHLKLGVNINTTNIDGLTALHQACIDANIEMVKFLVDNGADINAQDNEGWTPLHASVSVGNLEVCKYLVQKNAKLNICNNDSDLPIDLCDSTNIQMKNFLDDEMRIQQIDPDFEKQKEELIMYEDAKAMNFRDKIHQKTGATPLHVSAAKGYTRVMRLLLQSGANVNALDNDGWSPLHAAAHWEQEEACQILSEYGASFEIKNYAGQTPFDVCDNEMVNKLKAIQSTAKPVETTRNEIISDEIDTHNRLDSKVDSRGRRISDEATKSTIVRLPNEAKSSIGEWEKKQEKIVLSPIITNTKPAFDSFPINSDTEPDKKSKISEQKPVSNEEKPKSPVEVSKPTSFEISKPRPGRAEAEEQTGEKISRWGTAASSDTASQYGSSSRFFPGNSEAIPSKDTNSSRPLTEEQLAKFNADKVAQDSRRYSSAPIASKDEQAELIRKQKAKLERHFRRSTQAVSYEDIKSAEATIKGGGQNPLSPTSPSPVSPAYSSDFDSPGFATKPSQGVSSLSSLFGEKVVKPPVAAAPSTPPAQQNQRAQPSLTVTITNPAVAGTSGSNNGATSASSSASTSTGASSVLPATSMSNSFVASAVPTLVTASANESIEKDAIIANDIDTDKLLNAIEKSKGFSDTHSTTAARRLRNRANPYGMSSLSINSGNSTISNDESLMSPLSPQTPLTATESGPNGAGSSNTAGGGKKINKLIWNEEKLEVEYRAPDAKSDSPSASKSEESPPPVQSSSHSSRQTSRFGQSDSGFNASSSSAAGNNGSSVYGGSSNLSASNGLNSLANNRSNVKRSVSQVPTTERRPLPQLNAISINQNQSFVSNVSNMFNPSSAAASKSDGGGGDKKDYQLAYETLKMENDQLNQIVVSLKKELEDNSKRLNQINESTLDKKEKRAFDRRISELEEEIKKMESLKQDNTRLKEENAALIRVISKLSK